VRSVGVIENPVASYMQLNVSGQRTRGHTCSVPRESNPELSGVDGADDLTGFCQI